MRLLSHDNHGKLIVSPNSDDQKHPYAILSHTWSIDEEDEVSFDNIASGTGLRKPGYAKIQFCAEQAQKDKLIHFWVDTCCIDKRSHVELSEAITSMYRWYQKADVCYVYLEDVSTHSPEGPAAADGTYYRRSWKSDFRKSRWFTRGWTLQELIAPDEVVFFSKNGERLGTKRSLKILIHEITERLRWARTRNTKKAEDQAYSLLGIFGVYMPFIYGERDYAFVRLMKHIEENSSATSRLNHARALVNLEPAGRHAERCRGSIGVSTAVDQVALQERRTSILHAVGFEQMDSRRSTIKRAHSTTCRWFLQHPVYLNWIDPIQHRQHRGFLWINGKPGAGKSTLMKFAHAHVDKARQQDELVISFFFNARGEKLEKSVAGMYRALLFQLLDKVPDLRDLLDYINLDGTQQKRDSVWRTELLCEMLSTAILRLQKRSLKCFIDALDECNEEEVREMVRWFEDIEFVASEAGCQLYICFASRHYPSISTREGQKLILEDEQSHGDDLTKYIHNHLRAGEGEDAEDVSEKIKQKANGIFMWVVLVIDLLNKEYQNGRIFAVRRRLKELPEKLGDLFKDLLRRDSTNMTDLLLCLQWVLFARRPLLREEFYFAMVAGLDPSPSNLTEWNPQIVTEDRMKRFVLSSSKGLAELTKSKKPTVQFIHESVKDFLIKDNGLHELWPGSVEDVYSLSHDRLKKCCETYLAVDISNCAPPWAALPQASDQSTKTMRSTLSDKFPFLEYASQNVLYHANEAAGEIPQQEFLEKLDLKRWLYVTTLLERYNIRRHTAEVDLLYVLAEHNHAKLISMLSHKNPFIVTRGARYRYALFAALANGHRNTIRALLHCEESEINELVPTLPTGQDFSVRKEDTPLLWAIYNTCEVLAVLLMKVAIASGLTSELMHRDRTNQTLLMWASKAGIVSVVKLLLEEGAEIDTRDEHGHTALSWAARDGKSEVVQLLLNSDANIEARDNLGVTPLMKATIHGKSEIVQLLIDSGADVKARSNNDYTALAWAAGDGKSEVVQLLLDSNANIEARDNAGHTALSCAASYGKLLLDSNADIEARDNVGHTALSWAAVEGESEVVRLLNNRKAHIEARDKN